MCLPSIPRSCRERKTDTSLRDEGYWGALSKSGTPKEEIGNKVRTCLGSELRPASLLSSLLRAEAIRALMWLLPPFEFLIKARSSNISTVGVSCLARYMLDNDHGEVPCSSERSAVSSLWLYCDTPSLRCRQLPSRSRISSRSGCGHDSRRVD
jgi:hypothetical protein